MNDNKVLVNFRISKERKKQLEFLAGKRGVSITQFLDLLIFDTISNTLKTEGILDAIEQAATMIGLEKNIAQKFRNTNGLSELKKIMDEEKFTKLVDAFMQFIVPCCEKYRQEFGLEEEEIEVEKILKEIE